MLYSLNIYQNIIDSWKIWLSLVKRSFWKWNSFSKINHGSPFPNHQMAAWWRNFVAKILLKVVILKTWNFMKQTYIFTTSFYKKFMFSQTSQSQPKSKILFKKKTHCRTLFERLCPSNKWNECELWCFNFLTDCFGF